MFKRVLYAEEIDDLEHEYESMIEDDIVVKYPSLISYLSTLYDISESWGLAYRKDLRIRGNNTNNPVESQFLVLKDEVLNRTKEVNINGLLGKLSNEFNDHYKLKLLNVASGKFDGCYANRFKGKGNVKGDKDTKCGIGFRMLTREEQDRLLSGTVEITNGIYTVPSVTDPSVLYTVDMSIGICSLGRKEIFSTNLQSV